MGLIEAITWIIIASMFCGTALLVANNVFTHQQKLDREHQDTLRAREYTKQLMWEHVRAVAEQQTALMRPQNQESA